VLSMLHARQHLPLRRTIAFQLIGHDHAWDILGAFEELAEDRLRRGTVKLTDSEAIIGPWKVSSHRNFSYAAVLVAVISRQMCRLWAITWR
jgi:hypothetical protein